MESHIEFEKPIATLEKKLADLRKLTKDDGVDLSNEIRALEKKLEKLIEDTFANLTTWQRVQLSRHPNRPYSRDYIECLFPDFTEMHGDRTYGDDPAIMCGIASWPPKSSDDPDEPVKIGYKGTNHGHPIMIIGHQKGRTTKQKMLRNFGMAKPEGYRKAIRAMELANRAGMPILTFIDTPGAYPGIETEERGQAQAIAECLQTMFSLEVPVASIVIGEGGSGGALAIGVANQVFMMEYSTYSVISPEGCASILWSDATLAEKASEVLKITATDLLRLNVIDGVIREPKGGAHRHWNQTFESVGKHLVKEFDSLISSASGKSKKSLDAKQSRFEKFMSMTQDSLAKTKSEKKTKKQTKTRKRA